MVKYLAQADFIKNYVMSFSKVVIITYRPGKDVPRYVTKVIIDSSVTEIPDFSFREYHQLEEVVFNKRLNKIGRFAFEGCRSLRLINIPSSVTEIGDRAFCKCDKLSQVILNNGLQVIQKSTFFNCPSLECIELPSTVTILREYAFDSCRDLREVILNNGLLEIEYGVFFQCWSLESIEIPSSVTKVKDGAFLDCNNIKQVLLNVGLHEIEPGAFQNCESLDVVKFPMVTNRVMSLIKVGQTEVVRKVTVGPHCQWFGRELLVSPEALSNENWETTKENFEQAIAWVSYYELREATTIVELALWKMKIEETGAATVEERDACRGEVPGPLKDAIIQYLGVDIGVERPD